LIAIDVSNRADFEYSNMGPEINPDQQLINNGKLFAENEDAVLGTEKQRHYRSLIRFRSMAAAMPDQLETLKRDEDMHWVSETSILGLNSTHNDRSCSIDCPLKMHLRSVPNNLPALLNLDQFEVDDLAVADAEAQRSQVYEALKTVYMRTLELHAGSFGDPLEVKLQVLPINSFSVPKGSSPPPGTGYEALSYTWGKPFPQFPICAMGSSSWLDAASSSPFNTFETKTDP
jgi:hypothetical protein